MAEGSEKTVVVVGGGAAGLMASLHAAAAGARTTVLEQNDKTGRKLLVTGNGRCNLTNLSLEPDSYRGEDPSFILPALERFGVMDTLRFFSELGIYTVNRQGYMYPRSGQAASVRDVLLMEAQNRKVRVKTREKVLEIKRTRSSEKRFLVRTEGWQYPADAVILANGSPASDIPGACSSGYDLAASLGHHVIKPLPALVPLVCKEKYPWAGVRTEGELTLLVDGKPAARESGELQLTDYGISGIPVFQLSRYAVRALEDGKRAELLVDFFPDYPENDLEGFLETRKKNCPYKSTRELLIGLFPDKLIKVLTSREPLIRSIKAFPLTVKGSGGFERAQVCQGGVDTAEVDPVTMESRLCPGLFFAGEILDIDGKCGGYNLQWAWSSGAAAGKATEE